MGLHNNTEEPEHVCLDTKPVRIPGLKSFQLTVYCDILDIYQGTIAKLALIWWTFTVTTVSFTYSYVLYIDVLTCIH